MSANGWTLTVRGQRELAKVRGAKQDTVTRAVLAQLQAAMICLERVAAMTQTRGIDPMLTPKRRTRVKQSS